MPDFKGTEDITLQPGDATVPYTFALTPCTSATANDGAIPFGTTVSSVAVTAHKQVDGTVITSDIIVSSSVSSNVVTVNLKYPATSGEGEYHLQILATLNTGAILEFDFNRVKARNK